MVQPLARETGPTYTQKTLCLPIHTAARLRLGSRLLVKMVDFQNPAVIEKDFREFTSWHNSKA